VSPPAKRWIFSDPDCDTWGSLESCCDAACGLRWRPAASAVWAPLWSASFLSRLRHSGSFRPDLDGIPPARTATSDTRRLRAPHYPEGHGHYGELVGRGVDATKPCESGATPCGSLGNNSEARTNPHKIGPSLITAAHDVHDPHC